MSKDLSPWTPRHATEPTHEKNYDVAEALGLHHMHAYGLISAFRARYPLETPSGRLRGGKVQIERLAIWDGTPGALADAFVKAGIVDLVDGVFVAHEHSHYAGAALAARSQGRDRQQRYRERAKSHPSSAAVTVTGESACDSNGDSDGDGDVIVTLTHSLTVPDLRSDSGSGSDPEIANSVPSAAPINRGRMNPDAPAPLPGTIVGRTGIKRGAGFMEDTTKWPQTPAELIERHPELRTTFPALDGSPGQGSLIVEVSASWAAFVKKRNNEGPAFALDGLISWIGDRYGKHHERWLRAGNKVAAPSPAAQADEHRRGIESVHAMRCQVAADLGLPKPPHHWDETEAFDAWDSAHPQVQGEMHKRRAAAKARRA